MEIKGIYVVVANRIVKAVIRVNLEDGMSNIKIAEYRDIYAKAVAKMWEKTNGSEGWNGASEFPVTEEAVIKDVQQDHIKIYLAFNEDEEVVGYCNLKKDYKDENAAYVKLLNVRPDFHGKKVGKELLLKSLEETLDLGYDKLNLHTWTGNTKAIPLYKKCGFVVDDSEISTPPYEIKKKRKGLPPTTTKK